MAKRKSAFSIFIPISILSDVSSLIEKTFKVGQIARSASIFRVERIVIYRDSPSASQQDGFLIRDLLAYAETVAGWGRYGAAVGETKQLRRCATA